MQDLPSKDLAPTKAPKLLSSLLSTEASAAADLKPRHRYIYPESKENWMGAIFVCHNMIFVIFKSGDIKIYNSVDLQCQTRIKSCHNQTVALYIQCTGTEVIVKYFDSSIRVWDIGSGQLMDTIIEGHAEDAYVNCMRWRAPYFVVGKENSKIGIWQRCPKATFTFLGEWNSNVNFILAVGLDDDYIVVSGHVEDKEGTHYILKVFHFNGTLVRTIC